MEKKMDGIGRVIVDTVPLPEGITEANHPMYTSSGKILFANSEKADGRKDYFDIATINDDGSDYRVIYSGVIPMHPTANGFRMMPFADGKRVLLGDYVLETTPDIASCTSAEVIPVEYPALLMNDPGATHHWSEIVIAPDNVHMAWTSLRGFSGAVNYLGALRREADRYVLDNVQVISAMDFLLEDPTHPGYLLQQAVRGGEIKQFVHGGTALSLAGAGSGALPDSVIQDFLSEDITPVTNMPSYEETTILSPDEHLGIVMSTRGSPTTNFAVLGLLPRPLGRMAAGALTMNVYLNGVTAVRAFRKGNVGPVLIDIEQSMREAGYPGVQLNDPDENWVYHSPMSWHPGGKSAIWPEALRGTKQSRIQIVRLPDYTPAPAVAMKPTPDVISYGIAIEDVKIQPRAMDLQGKIAGKHSGYAVYRQAGKQVSVEYVDMSDDGRTFYHGFERSGAAADGGLTYEARVTMDGAEQGEMDVRMVFSPFGGFASGQLPMLRFENAEDGKPMSTGHATYQGVTLSVEDMRM